jgi:Tfp pilus assembly protein PilN
MEHERLCLEREKENSTLEKLVKQLKDEVALLTRMLKQPDTLNTAEQALLETLLQTNGGAPDQ